MPLNSSTKMNSLLSDAVKIIQVNEVPNLDRPEHKLLSCRLLSSAKFVQNLETNDGRLMRNDGTKSKSIW